MAQSQMVPVPGGPAELSVVVELAMPDEARAAFDVQPLQSSPEPNPAPFSPVQYMEPPGICPCSVNSTAWAS
jgi:hypothetical protein